MKYHIEKNSPQETLIIPLYGRKKCTELFPDLFQDSMSLQLLNQIDYDFSEIEKKSNGYIQKFGYLEVAMRQNDLAFEVKEYLKSYPNAAIVNMGCGLDNTGKLCDNGTCHIYNIDFPDVIEIRNELLPSGLRETNIPADLNDTSWFTQIDASHGVVFFAAGVFYYFLTEDVKKLFLAMQKAFPNGRIVFDICGKTGAKMMQKTWLKEADIQNVNAYFSVNDVLEDIGSWSNDFKISWRGYMLGYQSLNIPSVKTSYRFLAKICDSLMKMRIIKIDF